MTVSLIPQIKFRWFDSNGNPLAGGQVFTYSAGTTSPATTYSDRNGLVPNTNPVILDSSGFAPIYLDDSVSYKIVVKNSLGVVQQTVDGIKTQALQSSVSILDFGAKSDGVTNDADSLVNAIQTGKRVIIPPNTFLSLTPAQASVVLSGFNQISPDVSTTINIEPGVVNLSQTVNIYNPDAINIKLVGHSVPSTTASAVNFVSGSAKNSIVNYSLASATNVEVGDYIIIASSSGTGNYRVVEGCFKVIGKSGNVVTVKHTMNAVWPSADFTFTSATVYPVKTILKWPLNEAGLRIAGCSLAQLSNVILAGSFDISSGTASDSPGDGLQVGSAPDTFNTGANESEQINAGAVWASKVGIVEWQGNGLQVSGGNFYGTLVSACSNGWRGFQAARAGSAEAKFSSAVGNGASGYEAEAEGFMNADASVSNGNHQQGYYVIGSGTVLVGRGHSIYNQTGIDSRNFGIALADQAFVRKNTLYGLYSISGFILFGSGASTASNSVRDVWVLEGGLVNANGASSLGTYLIDSVSGAQLVGTDGKLIFPSANFLENTAGNQVKFGLSSITDLTFSFDTTASGTFTDRVTMKNDGQLIPVIDVGPSLGRAANRWNGVFCQNIFPGAGTARWTSGTGSPEGVVSAAVGSMYTRTDGATGSTLYVKETGGGGNTGWVAK